MSFVFGPKYGIYWDQWSDFTCKARAYAYIAAEVCSNVYAAFFSVVRALALYKPLFSKRYLTPARIRQLIGIMLAYILIVCTPAWYSTSTWLSFICSFESSAEQYIRVI